MMTKKTFLTLIVSLLITTSSFSAGSSSSSSSSSNYDKAVKLIKSAKKFEQKEKVNKAKKNYEKAQKLLVKYNINNPKNADTLNYLGFTTRKLGDFSNGEKYYLQGLAIEPKHIGINEYLGELYVATNRIDLAKERLQVLKDCSCKEFKQLKDVIEGNKKSKY